MYRNLLWCLTVLSMLVVCGCARDIGGNTYSESSVGEVGYTYEGVIESVRFVNVKGNEKVSDNATGALLGGVTGGVLGNMFGGGKGRVATTALGAVGGAVGGAYLEDKLSSQQAVEYSVRLSNGKLYTVVQGKDVIYNAGQKVHLIINYNGRSRIKAI